MTATSLDLMHDIIVPPAVSFWPLAPGWLALALLLAAYIFHVVLKLGSIYRANAYKREALQELNQISEEKAVLNLMKRVALHAFGRVKVASLTGDSWWEFIETHSSVEITALLRNYCHAIVYQSDTKYNHKYNHAIRQMAILWIQTHQRKDYD